MKSIKEKLRNKRVAVLGLGDENVALVSYLIKEGDEIGIRHKGLVVVQNALESVVRRGVPSWIEVDKEKMTGKIRLLPARDDITVPIKEQLIVEYYSR